MPIINDGKAKKLTLADVHENFEKYNFLLFTKMGTIDTEKYNIIEKVSQPLNLAGQNTTAHYYLVKVKGDPTRYSSNLASPDGIIEKFIEITDNATTGNPIQKGLITVERIQIKSNRDFLKKGNKAKKLG